MSLERHRRKIDKLDEQVLALLNQRARIVKEIGRIKSRKGDDVYASGREREILQRLVSRSRGPLPGESIEQIFQEIITACRSLQKRLKVAFLGPEATFTHQAAVKHFGRQAEYLPVASIADVFDEVEKERADYGVVPIENSTEGVVNHTLDMFVDSDLMICAEREEPIRHYLISASGEVKKIKMIYSHPQAIAQCRRWLEAHVPQASLHEAASTADAAAHASLDASSAAIASALAAQIYRLKIVASRVEDSAHNATRFLVVGRKFPSPSGHDKTSILFSLKDHVGALHDVLIPFKTHSLNLTRIESRPTKKKAWEYIFFADINGHLSNEDMKLALEELKESCVFLKVLGSYPQGDS